LLAVHHSRTGRTQELHDAALVAAREAAPDLPIRVLGAFEAGPDDVMWARGLLLATPARFGYMSGALKDFFERIYHPCLDRTRGLPYALIVKGDTDVDGAVSSVQRIVVGLAWRLARPVLAVVGDVGPEHLEAAVELGGGLAAGLEAGIF
jgi:NAD(P)H-dependent FMN reductase